MTEATRGYIYRFSVALIPALLALGSTMEGQAQVWVNFAAAVVGALAAALAVKNTSVDPPLPPPPPEFP